MNDIDAIMQLAPVIPVLVIDDVSDARPIAEALVAGGLPVLEVTLRTPAALEAIREMTQVEGAVVGAGTVLNDRDLEASLEGRRAIHRLAGPHRRESAKQRSPLGSRSCPVSPPPPISCAGSISA